jgi:hypothetical protein
VVGGRGEGEGTARWLEMAKGGAHLRQGEQHERSGDAIGLGLPRRRWLHAEAGECEGAWPCLGREENGGGRDRGSDDGRCLF